MQLKWTFVIILTLIHIRCFGMICSKCKVMLMYAKASMSGRETMHEHKQALAWQTLSHAKGHYLAAVNSNRRIAGWETVPGSAASLHGCTIWQLEHISVSAAGVCACTHKCKDRDVSESWRPRY